jgi:phage portal protein BeeE
MNFLQSLTRAAWPPSGGVLEALYQQLGGGGLALNQTLGGKIEEIDNGYTSLVMRAFGGDSIVFACMMARMNLFCEMRFQWRQVRFQEPGKLFGTPALDILRHPWANATTADLLKYVITDADIAGNAFLVRTVESTGPVIKRLRPDWVTMILGSHADPNIQAGDVGAEFLGILYHPGGRAMGRAPVPYDRGEIAHFAPVPDPLAAYRGMSWLTPIMREVMGDQAATEHKLRFFENGATANLVIKTDLRDPVKFQEWVAAFEQQHAGSVNAYKTLYMTPGVDATVIGANMQQIEFKATQGAGETRICAAARVPAAIAGVSEGLQGSSLNAGNLSAEMRLFGEMTMRPLWRNLCGSLESIVPPPARAELWYDDSDIPALQVNRTDAAQIQSTKATTIETLIRSGFTAQSIIDAVETEDMTALEHTGLFSVQLQAPGSKGLPAGEAPGEIPVGGTGTAPAQIAPGDITTKPVGTTAPVEAVPAGASNGK